MKTHNLFSSVILIGFGLYYLLSQSSVTLFDGFYSWPTLLCIVGLAFLAQAYKAKQYEYILPGIILLGFGIHFHVIQNFHFWSDNIGVFILIISLGLMLQAQKTNKGMLPGILILAIAVFILFNDAFMETLHSTEMFANQSVSLVPIILLGFGILVLFFKK
ncbi:LiaI-LiaF-like domain-containing protein [Bacillus testis]|uniref:LiaI-LiaF-like domain-containing protein n=1 Tax=Bacillus testis TaxID=1622072 RepID=UPI00067EE3DC|nr:DUF5668 domain-containing protein [Bacillus testis]